ncbi:MAG: phenylalanine--tRNA ligase subunit alpha [Candidatus Marinimicrobia bacterium]|jgi:phenylalanyl-tRNA synthetase alpha chain|nr:phenylalanine--tRNA ligase subunit alpha [Candidatus Neomarinimicrobiota bacterium]MBT3575613.1 phenylalanine--tRNA ligase subunit alpha [Candidatus Neomarinimicrobiota bacterium]MBT3680146.1 phenylalanine--tRNA ligase subunit alpha [Candidatus Neomarinimicrobiota bacterium]MBT3950456.1 phenylalanine--tRNA ligase subunit alpha [Candidatus Neomarinimicrobiota bacterium]MBT4251858.1 phenylalanine--tRNA ligase subunit alpha [Candidatus Neomarinimicrobiota bacterium]
MSLFNKVDELRSEFKQALASSPALSDLERMKQKYLGRKGVLNDLFKKIVEVENDRRGEFGSLINQLKLDIHDLIEERINDHRTDTLSISAVDVTLPGVEYERGTLHPIESTLRDFKQIFHRLGFAVAEGPEIETQWRNFDALNFPPEHPARDMQDTFFLENDSVLRTHTSPVQVRLMLEEKPPIRSIMPGRVYRNEAIDAGHYCLFHQVEGLYVDKNVTMGELKATLELFCREYFGENVKLRFRPSFFPFTEPSSEMDVSCFLCGGKGCRVCKQTGWLEIGGCGMVDPNVFKAVNIDSEEYTGYAFGMGIERIAMMKYGITDIRLLFENDVRFLKQF